MVANKMIDKEASNQCSQACLSKVNPWKLEKPNLGYNMVIFLYLPYKMHELIYTLATKVCIQFKLDPMIHGTSNLDHYCISNMFEKLQNG